MQIICPECKFAREVDETKIPARSMVATCPKCQTKFKFRELPEEEFVIEDPVEPTPESVAAPEPDTAPAPATASKEETDSQAQAQLPLINTLSEEKQTDEGLWERLDRMRPPEERSTVDNPPASEASVSHPSEPERPAYTPPAQEKPAVYESYESQQADDQQPVEGWTGEFNEDFPDPAQFDDDGTDEDDMGLSQMQVPPPFEQLDRYGFFHGLFMTIKLVLFSPRVFFSVMPVGGGVAKPLTYAILVGMVQAVVQFGYGSAGLSISLMPSSEGFVPVPYDLTSGIFELLLTPAAVAVLTYAMAGLYSLLLTLIRSNNKGFEGTFRAFSYAYTPAILAIIPMLNSTVYMGVALLSGIWSLVLTAIGMKHIHKISYTKVIPVMIVPFLLLAIVSILMMQSQLATM
ncbi:YIP1 family protein [Pseudodesulfovibrio sediminis]|uniref:Yip1 domain-containing protein n=1 Tax=Pseudodesulfovibrio sediminis TaxID=2810563 RepID=A0ABN6EVI0_9BACT|nr:YIP1 family protein [Pseudodesulfovibrio sediminis]BCS90297.1 hypothetical protein PSDVSF_35390 [Pseudodesulfovibrio sediminis]